MTRGEAGAQGHDAPVPVPEPGALLPLVDKMVMSSSETSEKVHGVPMSVPPVAGAEDKRRHARRRRMQMVLLNRVAYSEVETKRARPVFDISSGSSAKVAPEPQPGAAAAAPAPAVWPKSLSHGAQSVIGRRRSMEDVVAVAAPLPVPAGEEVEEEGGGGGWVPEFFAVYDGHGGAWVAEACRDRLHVALAEEMARLGLANGGGGEEDAGALLWREAMAAAFARVDGEVSAVQAAEGDTKPYAEGSSAVVAVLEPSRIVVAHCGDSRAVLCRGGVPVPLSTEHKPERPDELARIESAGGQILYWHGPRVLGVLSMSRSIGDYFLKPSMSAEPEVTVTDRTDTDEFIILGSDGLWNAMSNEYACKVTRYCLSGRLAANCPATTGRGSSASDAAALLVEMAMARGSEDNVSAVVVELSRLAWRKKAACQNGRT
ncbi:unnamed protein product [Urochloa decumbens]|uniref:protein-serine/threonine phosphatase n=1 Tax=Urochloa decumbens TaxID=240449 RepID=A0ABC8Z4H4_9POAL